MRVHTVAKRQSWVPNTGVLTPNPVVFPLPKYFPGDIRADRRYAKKTFFGAKYFGKCCTLILPLGKSHKFLSILKALRSPAWKELD